MNLVLFHTLSCSNWYLTFLQCSLLMTFCAYFGSWFGWVPVAWIEFAEVVVTVVVVVVVVSWIDYIVVVTTIEYLNLSQLTSSMSYLVIG